MNTKNSEIKTIEYACNGKIITFNEPQVMAIVNITPDSFYDGGKYGALKDILYDTEEKINQGAKIIDLGAASSRPGATGIEEDEEWQRLKDVLEALRKEFPSVLISIDTYRAVIAEKSAGLGADIINDISGGMLDDKMFETIARISLPYVLMHMQGTPQTMQKNPSYADVTGEIYSDFGSRIKELEKLGFNKLIVDPGFGFGKTVNHNFTLLKELARFEDLGFPILAGVSRKGMISKITGTSAVTALNGTTVLNTIALLNGASVLRVHDVTEAMQAIQLVQFYNNV
ncbi:MAG: dihydropteroate synthase [Bacteroidota bacterium]